MEARRAEAMDGTEWLPVRRGWCLGPAVFKKDLLERMAGKLGAHHADELKREGAETKAEDPAGRVQTAGLAAGHAASTG
jgi:hypothetical protein